jgi:hypothetical protein
LTLADVPPVSANGDAAIFSESGLGASFICLIMAIAIAVFPGWMIDLL